MNCNHNLPVLEHICFKFRLNLKAGNSLSIQIYVTRVTEAVQQSISCTHSMFIRIESLLDFSKLCRQKCVIKKGEEGKADELWAKVVFLLLYSANHLKDIRGRCQAT